MYPHERSLVEQLSDQPFALIGVNSDGELDKAKSAVADNNLTWRSFWNGPDGTDGPIARQYRVRGWPTIYLLDAEGRIRYKQVHGEELDQAIATLLAEMGHPVELSHDDETEP